MPSSGIASWVMAWLVLAGASVYSQTRLDLRNQSMNVDHSAAAETLPFRIGTSLPATCRVGSTYVKTNADANGTVYLCSTVNVWKPLGSALLASGLEDLRVKTITSQQLSIGDLCSPSSSCNVSLGGTSYHISAPATATLSGQAFSALTATAYLSAEGIITIEYDSTIGSIIISCVNCTASGVPSPHYPEGSLPLADITLIASGGAPHWGTITDRREFLKSPSISEVTAAIGGGATITCTAGACQAGVDTSYTATQPGHNDFSGNNRFGAGVEGLDNTITNDTVTGTADGLIATWAGGKAVKTSLLDEDGTIGLVISGGGTTGLARIRHRGFGDCIFDGPTTAGNYVQPSTSTAGRCHDAGAARPLAGTVIGRVVTSGTGAQRIWIEPAVSPLSAAVIDVKSNQQATSAVSPDWATLSVTAVPALRASSCTDWKAWLTNVSATSAATIRLRFGSSVVGTATLTADGFIQGMICNTGTVTAQWGSYTFQEAGSSAQARLMMTENTSASQNLTIEVQSATADVIQLNNYMLTMVR